MVTLGLLSDYIDWSCDVLTQWSKQGKEVNAVLSPELFKVIAVLYSLVQLLKRGNRNNNLPYVGGILKCCAAIADNDYNQSSVRKLTTKLFQRVGITLLPPRLCNWRYQRGKRLVLLNNLVGAATAEDAESTGIIEEESSEDILADNEARKCYQSLECIIDFLMLSLRDSDTVVRWYVVASCGILLVSFYDTAFSEPLCVWCEALMCCICVCRSAAKGVGRITMCLPKPMAYDVIDSLLVDCFGDSKVSAHLAGSSYCVTPNTITN